jgi:DNA-binding response OmpR family regulator
MTTSQAFRVVLVEDDPSLDKMLQTLLEIEGFQVVSVIEQIGQPGLVARIKDEKPDIILMDVHLRSKNGIEILRQIREEKELMHTRVVMSSGVDAEGVCIAAGASDFILKPYMPDEILAKLRG